MKKSLINIIQIWMTEMKEIMHDKGIMIFIIFVPLCYQRGGARRSICSNRRLQQFDKS